MLADKPNGSASSIGSYGSYMVPFDIPFPKDAPEPASGCTCKAVCDVFGFAARGCGMPAGGSPAAEYDVGKVGTPVGCSVGSCSSSISSCASYSCSVRRLVTDC